MRNLEKDCKKVALKKALALSFSLNAILILFASFCGWYFGFEKFWLIPVIFILLFSITTTCLYFFKYRPNLKEVAREIDSLGLEERLITMEEYKNDNSFIAKRQREDTINILKTFKGKINFALPTVLLILFSITIILSSSMTSVYALSTVGILPSGKEITEKLPEKYILQYTCSKGGKLVGITSQYVLEGNEGKTVIASPDEGYIFLRWSDGLTSIFRQDEAKSNLKVEAIFVHLDDYEPDEELIYPDKDGKNDNTSNRGSEKNQDDLPPFDKPDKNNPDKTPGGGTGGGADDDSFYIIDGKTNYGGKVLSDARQNAVDRANSGNLSNKEKELIDGYYDAIDR